jgi:hypothetical protein
VDVWQKKVENQTRGCPHRYKFSIFFSKALVFEVSLLIQYFDFSKPALVWNPALSTVGDIFPARADNTTKSKQYV